jgi:hypothetical protein
MGILKRIRDKILENVPEQIFVDKTLTARVWRRELNRIAMIES